MLVTVLDVGKRNWTTSLESCGKDGSICLIAFASSSRCFTPRLVTSNKTRNDFSSCRILVSPFCNAGRADNTLSRHELLFPCELGRCLSRRHRRRGAKETYLCTRKQWKYRHLGTVLRTVIRCYIFEQKVRGRFSPAPERAAG